MSVGAMPTSEPPPHAKQGSGGQVQGARCDELGAIRGGTFRGEKNLPKACWGCSALSSKSLGRDLEHLF